MGLSIAYIRGFTQKGKIHFSEHAIKKMGERKIKRSIVLEAIINGKVIEEQDHGRNIKIIFQENTINTPACYAVVAAAHPIPEVVTVCKTYEEVWDYTNGILKRRGIFE